MKVLHLINSAGFFGAENTIVTLAHEQIQAGVTVYVGVFKNLADPHLEIVIAAHNYNLPVKIFPCKGKFDLKTIFEIRNFINQEKIDVIHSHGYKADFYALWATLFKRIKRVATCQNWLSINYKMKFYELLDKLLLHKFNKIIAVSGALKEEIIKNGLSKRKVLIINNGVDLNRFRPMNNVLDIKKELNLNSDCKVIGVISRLVPGKGHIYLLQAIRKLLDTIPNINCLIVGDGPDKKNLQFQVKVLGLEDKVVFTGIRSDIPRILNSIDIFVLPSLKEGMPMALLEAMATKKPVIATNVGAIPTIIDHSKTGLLVEPRSVEDIHNSLVQLLKDDEKANLLARNGFEKVKHEFSSRRMAEEYLKVYQGN